MWEKYIVLRKCQDMRKAQPAARCSRTGMAIAHFVFDRAPTSSARIRRPLAIVYAAMRVEIHLSDGGILAVATTTLSVSSQPSSGRGACASSIG